LLEKESSYPVYKPLSLKLELNNSKGFPIQNDILQIILDLLPFQSIVQLMKTNRFFFCYFCQDYVWERFSRLRMGTDSSTINSLSNWKEFFKNRYSTTFIRWIFTISKVEKNDIGEMIIELRMPNEKRIASKFIYPDHIEEDREVRRRHPMGYMD